MIIAQIAVRSGRLLLLCDRGLFASGRNTPYGSHTEGGRTHLHTCASARYAAAFSAVGTFSSTSCRT